MSLNLIQYYNVTEKWKGSFSLTILLQAYLSSLLLGSTSTNRAQSGASSAAASAIWGLYLDEARSVDVASVERWKGDMEGLLIFVSVNYLITISVLTCCLFTQAGLFSAVVTAFVIQIRNPKIFP